MYAYENLKKKNQFAIEISFYGLFSPECLFGPIIEKKYHLSKLIKETIRKLLDKRVQLFCYLFVCLVIRLYWYYVMLLVYRCETQVKRITQL